MWITQFPTLLAPCLIITPLDGAKRVIRVRANERNNSQHCCANNVGSYCVRVGSGVQTDATTPKPSVHRGKDTTHKSL